MNDLSPPLAPGWNTVTPMQPRVPYSESRTPARIREAASAFESILLTQWLGAAETSFGSVPGGDDDQDAGDEQMKGFAVQALSKALTAAGGIGLAKVVSRALTVHEAHNTPEPAGSPAR